MEAGTLSQPPSRKDKKKVPRSPCKQPTTTIIFPCIPVGVRVKEYLLGYVEKLRYLDHDVIDIDKFPEFTKQLYL
jgi:hypothetical protein